MCKTSVLRKSILFIQKEPIEVIILNKLRQMNINKKIEKEKKVQEIRFFYNAFPISNASFILSSDSFIEPGS